MRSGLLRNRVTVQYKVVSADAYGQEVITWTDLANAWADIQPLRGREFQEGAQTHAEVTHRIRMRYQPSVIITPEMRIVYGSRIFYIESIIQPAEIDRELVLMSREDVYASYSSAPAALSYAQKLLSYNPSAYWPLETNYLDYSGNEVHASAAGSGVTFTQQDGRPCAYFNGNGNDYINAFSLTLRDLFDGLTGGAKGTIMCWAKVFNAGVWTDGNYREFWIAGSSSSLNTVSAFKRNGYNSFSVRHKTNTTGTKEVTKTGYNNTSWFHVCQTWDETADELKLYLDGVLFSTTTGIGLWSESAFPTLGTWNIGSAGSLHTWLGWQMHHAWWKAQVLTPAQIAILATW